MKKNHNQTLEYVLAELPAFEHPRWQTVNDLIQLGWFFALIPKHVPGPKEQTVDKKGVKHTSRIFPADEWECPILAGDFLPCKTLPHIEAVKVKLWEEIQSQELRFSPEIKDTNTKLATALQLITSLQIKENNPVLPLNRERKSTASDTVAPIHNKNNMYGSSIVHLYSPALQYYCNKKFTVDGVKGTLNQTPHQVTIMPTGGYLETVYHQHYTVSTLFHGKKLWIVFPENLENMRTLGGVLKKLSTGDGDAVHALWREQLRELRNGIVFVQHVGETVILPPFWPHMTMSIEASLSTTSYVTKSVSFPLRLKYMHLSILANKMWPSDSQCQEHTVAFVKEFANHLCQIMKWEVEERQLATTKAQICEIWQGTRGRVTELLASISDPEIRESLGRDIHQAFVYHLEQKAHGSKECSICKQQVLDMEAPDRVHDEAHLLGSTLEHHFLKQHWN